MRISKNSSKFRFMKFKFNNLIILKDKAIKNFLHQFTDVFNGTIRLDFWQQLRISSLMPTHSAKRSNKPIIE